MADQDQETSPQFQSESELNLRSHPAFKEMPTAKECGVGLGQERIIGGKNVSPLLVNYYRKEECLRIASFQINFRCLMELCHG